MRTLGFEDALIYIKSGELVERVSCLGKKVMLGDGFLGRKTLVYRTQNGSEGIYIASNADILAEDWVLSKDVLKGAEVTPSVAG